MVKRGLGLAHDISSHKTSLTRLNWFQFDKVPREDQKWVFSVAENGRLSKGLATLYTQMVGIDKLTVA